MKNEIDVVRDFSQKFEKARIPYMLTGSVAMNYYAQPRMTRDVDVVISINSTNINSLVTLFEKDYYISRDAIVSALEQKSIFNLIHQESVIKVDCIIQKTDDYRRLEFERRKQVTIQDFTTFIVSKEDLIISKLSWARDSSSEKQIQDVKNLLATGYDQKYLTLWTQRLKLDKLLQKCSHE